MAHLRSLSTALFCLLATSLTDSLEPLPAVASSVPESANSFPSGESWLHPLQARMHRRRHGPSRHERTHPRGMPSKAQSAREKARAQLLSWSALEDPGWKDRPAGLQQKKAFLGFEIPYPEQENQAPGSEKGRTQNREHRRHSRRERLKQHRGICLGVGTVEKFGSGAKALYKKPENFEDQFQNLQLEGSSAGLSPTYVLGPTPKPSAVEAPALQSTSPRPQARLRLEGDVMPTLDMALFDWTDYEDLRPDMWPLSRKKEKRRSKNSSNETTAAEGDPCDHHLDCLPGCCCDLREHLCTPHNRGLNNKCYNDCMCTEGLRCYAKFHRNRRVIRRKGRCVEPDSADGDQGSGCMVTWLPSSYAWSNFSVLALGVWSVAQRDSVDAILMFLTGLMMTVLTDIIHFSLYYPHGASALTDTFRFSSGMAIFNLLLKPISCFLAYQMYRERGGEYTLNIGVLNLRQDRSAYQPIDTPDPPVPYPDVATKAVPPRPY
ncbi:hypothetical protein JRQ81_010046 [Phrynocephalus forsythii]|uniref:Dorsal inhibitory axon guidance protein n=1 Tax=Phrynocephalus forsythii TaxID=171643 RepID=A0A9Q0XA57_9SAUR|nr:hypothetical protein JRQ81_010046 [Phrynocephalus forsythii]